MDFISIFEDTLLDKAAIPSVKNNGQRAIGDIIEGNVIDQYKHQTNFIPASGAKSTDDFSLEIDGVQVMVDVKTHNLNAEMSMPNLISMKKLRILLQDDTKALVYNIVSYTHDEEAGTYSISIKDKQIIPIHHLNLDALGIGALGWGQLQIKNLKKVGANLYNTTQTKEEFSKGIDNKYKEFAIKERNKWDKLLETL